MVYAIGLTCQATPALRLITGYNRSGCRWRRTMSLPAWSLPVIVLSNKITAAGMNVSYRFWPGPAGEGQRLLRFRLATIFSSGMTWPRLIPSQRRASSRQLGLERTTSGHQG